MYNDEIPKIVDDHNILIQMDTSGAIIVKGIENWILTLVAEQEVNENNIYNGIRMKDLETGALFVVARLKE